jgi:hypothetical protein
MNQHSSTLMIVMKFINDLLVISRNTLESPGFKVI